METLNLLNALNQTIEREATIKAAAKKEMPAREAYWMMKFKMYREAVENIFYHMELGTPVEQAIREEGQKIWGGLAS